MPVILVLLKFNNPAIAPSVIPALNSEVKTDIVPLKLANQRIEFLYTDDNADENIIIKTNQKHYRGNAWSNVYISLTNTTNLSQNAALLFYFLKEKKQDNMVTLQQFDKNEWQYLTFYKNSIKFNVPKLDLALAKRETIPETFEVKSGTQINIPANSVTYFVARLEYAPGTSGEFWIETLGDKGAYGLLDPVYGTTISTDTAAGWYSGSWSYRKKITIDNNKVSGSSDFTNFPVLFSRTDSDFRHTSFGGNVASASAGVSGGGGDFVFTSSNGTTKLDHEIEKYASSSGELLAWVEVPTLGAITDTAIYVYYGGPSSGATNQNKTGVWDSDYKGVWHLPESGDSTGNDYLDSTTNANNLQGGGGTAANVPTQSSSGLMNGAQNFDGSNDLLNRASTTSLEITGSVTLSAWVNVTDSGSEQVIIAKPESDTSHTNPYFDYSIHLLRVDASTLTPRFWTSSSNNGRNCASTVNISTGSWYYIIGVYNGSSMKTYVDGVERCTTDVSGAIDNSAKKLFLGANGGSGEVFENLMDEVRISGSARSADWITTEYNNQSSSSTFYAVGGQEVANISEPLLKIKGGVIFR